ncbi:Chromosome-partitioning protein ParB [Methylocella tundrae]|uniref:Chromosome-partitioning protein ParB n=1 Tax=Methylocella tundrae TaxID=227605 RepID=A0A8B6MC22_METTU|nr:ParB/RepB/Spo0J family partition protein [Methylocella tundrae]VTZ52563.1 Chromosome-partitioning protein ParB [Methylocella tundrae]
MMKSSKSADELRPRLGRGLAALIGDSEDQAHARARGQKKVPIEFLRPNPRNPRKCFDEAELDDLAASVKEKGIIQPILARPAPGLVDAYEIIAGERRWRAAQRAGLHEAPIIVVEADDQQALELAIIENVQRSDLNALEEASGYDRLSAEFNYSQGDLAKVIGKSRSHVANTLRLLKLPEKCKRLLGEGLITAGHARALLGVADPDALAERIVAQGLSVRDVERIVQEAGDAERPAPRKPKEKDANTRSLETALTSGLGLKVTITGKGEKGELRIAYRTLEQLDFLCQRIQPSS